MPEIPVKIMMNVGNPQLAFDFQSIPNNGVGLARLEFIINNNIGIHPKACLAYPDLPEDLRRAVEELLPVTKTRVNSSRKRSPKVLPRCCRFLSEESDRSYVRLQEQ